MATVEGANATFERNIAAQTGRSVNDWVNLVRGHNLAKHSQMVAWLKAEHGLSHGVANHIAKRTIEALTPRSTDDPLAHLFEGGKENLRPLCDQLIAVVHEFGHDVEIAPKKANVSVRRRKQFALIQPSTRSRIDLGLILNNVQPTERLELSGSFNAMFTHRIKLSAAEVIDAELIAWLRQAYDVAH